MIARILPFLLTFIAKRMKKRQARAKTSGTPAKRSNTAKRNTAARARSRRAR
ncbi:hypothetical protein [Agreia sp. COWG]|uniref:hypothetical protein n=1 Tax=Agreia sp. COWG TaxID=2773266 RepID=UPI001928A83E|nr:hypothetical protein [Agreia sp. COWG]CAD6008890.1 exported protein of unknown function [Agreia sp. COWG]